MSELSAQQRFLYSTLGSDPELGDLVEMFIDEIPNRLDLLQDHWEQADWVRLSRSAHQLKGAAGSYGFAPLMPVLQRLEDRANQTDPLGAHEVLEELLDLCERIRPGSPE